MYLISSNILDVSPTLLAIRLPEIVVREKPAVVALKIFKDNHQKITKVDSKILRLRSTKQTKEYLAEACHCRPVNL